MGLEKIRERMCAFLNGQGLQTVVAWPRQEREEISGAVVSVALRHCEAGPSGFRDYLGERWNEETQEWEELYGRKTRLTFGLDLYAATAGEVQTGLDTLREALDKEGPAGMTALEFSAGEAVYEAAQRRYMCPAQAKFSAWAVAAVREDGTFLDFEVKGEAKE